MKSLFFFFLCYTILYDSSQAFSSQHKIITTTTTTADQLQKEFIDILSQENSNDEFFKNEMKRLKSNGIISRWANTVLEPTRVSSSTLLLSIFVF